METKALYALIDGAVIRIGSTGLAERAHAELGALHDRIAAQEAQLVKADENLGEVAKRHDALMQTPLARLGRWLVESPRRRWELFELDGGEMKRVALRDRRFQSEARVLAIGFGPNEDAAIEAAMNALPSSTAEPP